MLRLFQIELSQRQNASLLTTPTAGQTASSAVGQQLGQQGTEITRFSLAKDTLDT
jgi:hypothetical protein